MPNIKAFPKNISVIINTENGEGDHFLSANPDTTGAAFAEQGVKVKVAIYELKELREVSLSVISKPSK